VVNRLKHNFLHFFGPPATGSRFVTPWPPSWKIDICTKSISERYCRTVHCFQNIRFNKRRHPNEHRNRCRLSTKWPGSGCRSRRGGVPERPSIY